MKKVLITLGFLLALILLIFWALSAGLTTKPPPAVTMSLSHSNAPIRVFPGVGGVFMILPDGSLWRWGRTGVSPTPRPAVPEQVGTNCDWLQALAANGHCLAIRTNGTLWEWGWRGGTRVAPDPEQVDPGHDWIGIAAGDAHSVALKQDGTVWAWGDNTRSQLGNGPGLNQTKPVQVGTNTDWSVIGAGQGNYTLGLRTDGTLWVWGQVDYSRHGQSAGPFPFPIQICRETNWIGLNDGPWGLARTRTGELWDPLYSPPNPNVLVSTTCALMASNTVPGRLAFAVTFTALKGHELAAKGYEIRGDGTLWEAVYTYSRPTGTFTCSNAWRRVGKRSDWVSICGFGTILASTADGTLWTWGQDPGQEPIPDWPSKFKKLKSKIMTSLKLPPGTVSTLAYPPIQKSPRPLMRLSLITSNQASASVNNGK
jgi:alpha-tubulin suppressor-like RCC1 family protein